MRCVSQDAIQQETQFSHPIHRQTQFARPAPNFHAQFIQLIPRIQRHARRWSQDQLLDQLPLRLKLMCRLKHSLMSPISKAVAILTVMRALTAGTPTAGVMPTILSVRVTQPTVVGAIVQWSGHDVNVLMNHLNWARRQRSAVSRQTNCLTTPNKNLLT